MAPKHWQTGVIAPIHNKGDRRVCANYWDISLLKLHGKCKPSAFKKRSSIFEPQLHDTRIGEANAGLCELYRPVVTKWELLKFRKAVSF